jgi:surface antigen
MMSRRLAKTVAVLTLGAIAITGCETAGKTVKSNPKTTIGAAGGATVGGLIAAAASANPAAIAASVVGGLLVGGLVGNLLDDRDKRLQAEAAHRALETAPSGQSVSWKNPDSGHSGTVTPTKTSQTPGGTYCRDYQATVEIEGKKEQASGKACRQADGTWRIAG